MENTTVNSQRSSLQTIFSESKELATRAAAYGVSGAFANRLFSSISWGSLGVVTALNSGFVTAGQKLAGDDSLWKQTAATAVALALSSLTIIYGGASLLGRVGLEVSKQAVIQLAFLNAFGEVVKVAIPKLYHALFGPPETPMSADELKNLSRIKFNYLCNHIEEYAPKMPLEDSEFFDAFQTRLLHERGTLLPMVPNTLEDVKKLSLLDVIQIHDMYHEIKVIDDLMNPKMRDGSELLIFKSVMKALHHRFYEANLPFPKDDTVDQIERSKQPFYEVALTLPTSVEEVKALKSNQLSWVYAFMRRNPNRFPSALRVQAALYARFIEAFKESVFVPQLSVERLKRLSVVFKEMRETVFDLHNVFRRRSNAFINQPTEVKTTLNHFFEHMMGHFSRLSAHRKIPEVEAIACQDAQKWSEYFKNNPDQWTRPEMTQAHQSAFIELFDHAGCSHELEVRGWFTRLFG